MWRMGVRGHDAVAIEVGPDIFDVHCLGCPYGFQGFTWQGQAAAQEMIERHWSAVEKVLSDPNWQDSIEAYTISRELFGYTGRPVGAA